MASIIAALAVSAVFAVSVICAISTLADSLIHDLQAQMDREPADPPDEHEETASTGPVEFTSDNNVISIEFNRRKA